MPDFYTLYLVVLLLTVSHCIIWGLIVHRYPDLTAARYWLSASAVSVAGGVSLSLQGTDGLFLTTVLGNGFIILGFYLNWLGVIQFHHGRSRWRDLVMMMVISVMLMLATFYPWYGHNPLYTFAQAVPLALTATHLMRHHRRELGALIASMAMIMGCTSHLIISAGNVLILTGVAPNLQLINAAAFDLLVFIFAAVVWNFGFLLSAVDRLHEDVARLANEDDLTGLSNRRMFMNRLSALCEEEAGSESFSLMLFDLDRFKPINDKYGHAVGDAALRHVATLMRSQVQPGELLARLGGDEFGLLMPGRTAKEAALAASRIGRALRAAPLQHGDRLLHLTASIGIASSGYDATDPAALLERADHALYETKRSGRNGYTVGDVSPPSRRLLVEIDPPRASAAGTCS